jgi:hypothetical protein
MKAEWTVDDRARWDRLTRDAPWQQQWDYGESVRAMGGDVLRVMLRDGGRVVAAGQMTSRRLVGVVHAALTSRGPVFAGPDVPRAEVYRALTRETPLPWPRLCVLTPEAGPDEAAALRAAGLRRVMTGAAAAAIDLTPPRDNLRAAMDGKWRNRLRAAERAGALRVTLDDAPAAAALAKLEAEDRRQEGERGYRALPFALTAAWIARAGRRASLLASATLEGETVAQMLFVRHGSGALYHVGWANAEGRRSGAHPLLLWRAMGALKADGALRLDLGSIDTRRAPGLARFKLGAGARAQVMTGSWA